MSADTYHYLSVFREHTKQQLQSCVSVTTTLDPPLPQQTITTLAPFSALPTSIHEHSLVSLPFSSWLLHVFCCYRRKEKHSQERRKAWLQRVQVRQSPNTCCGFIDLLFLLAMQFSWTFSLIVCFLYTCRASGGVAVIHLRTLCGVHSCTVSPPLSTAIHTVIQLLFYSLYIYTFTELACTKLIIMSADTYHYLSVFREHTTQQLQSRVSVTTTLDPHLSQQTITTLAPFSALPTSIHQHSLVSLPFSSWLLHVFSCYRKKESQEKRKAWLQRVQVS